jgi:TolB-like protein
MARKPPRKNLFVLSALLALAVCGGCAGLGSTALKQLEPATLQSSLSATIAVIRDVSEEAVSAGLFDREKRTIELSEAAGQKLYSILQDSGCFSAVKIIPRSEIPDNATELTCLSLARREGTDLVIHGEVDHRASMTLNWLTWPSYIPFIAIGAPLWSPNYTLKGEVELTIHVVNTRTLDRVFSRLITEQAYTSVCFITRCLALHDRYAELEKEVALHNAAVEAANLLLKALSKYDPGDKRSQYEPLNKLIAVADFVPGSTYVEREGFGITAADGFTTAFEKSGVFKVIERQRIRDILAERAFSMTDLVQPDKAGQIAELLGMDYLLVGSVAMVGTRTELTVRLLDVSNGKVLLSESDGITRVEDLQILVELMAKRIIDRFMESYGTPGKK